MLIASISISNIYSLRRNTEGLHVVSLSIAFYRPLTFRAGEVEKLKKMKQIPTTLKQVSY